MVTGLLSNITFTVVVHLRDLTDAPKERRSIEVMIMPGGFVPRTQDQVVLQGKDGIPMMIAHLNPTSGQLRSELKFFDPREQARAHDFMKQASETLGGQRRI